MSSWVSLPSVCRWFKIGNRKKKRCHFQSVQNDSEWHWTNGSLPFGFHHCITICIIAWLLSFSFSLKKTKNKDENNSSCSNEPKTTWNSYFIPDFAIITHTTATSLTNHTAHFPDTTQSLIFSLPEQWVGFVLVRVWRGGGWVTEVDAGMLWTWTLCSDGMGFFFVRVSSTPPAESAEPTWCKLCCQNQKH